MSKQQRSAKQTARCRSIVTVVVLVLLISVSSKQALAQGYIKKKSDLPDASKFYMARQQITITDESPVINYRKGEGGGAGGGTGTSGPQPLQKAGWQPYSQMIPGLKTSLPKVNNGVPVKEPVSVPKPSKKSIGGMKAIAKQATSSSNPNAVSAYTPYKGYGDGTPQYGYGTGGGMQSRTNVRGSVLHWARSRRNH